MFGGATQKMHQEYAAVMILSGSLIWLVVTLEGLPDQDIAVGFKALARQAAMQAIKTIHSQQLHFTRT